MYLLQHSVGLTGLRVFHVVAVAAILVLAWLLLRRASGSRLLASLGTSCFAALAAYRLFQLRPELFSIFAALALYALLLEGGKLPSVSRIVLAALLSALWANLHAGFVLGPLLLAAGAVGLLLSLPLESVSRRPARRDRMRRLFAAVAACFVASLANPRGYAAYLPYLSAGVSTPDLGLVFDEWAPFSPFHFPAFNVQPTPLTFLLIWLLLVVTPLLCAGVAWRRFRSGRRDAALPFDPALLAVSGAALCASLLAVRFLWLGVFPLLLIFDTIRRRSPERIALLGTRTRWGLAAAAWLLVFGFVKAGDWPFLSRGIPSSARGYAEPYVAGKYHPHAAWFLQDTGLSGKLYNAYHQGGFLSFWLSPELQTFVDGSLNVDPEVSEAYAALQARRGRSAEEGFLELLDRYEIDLFIGIGLPSAQRPNRPWRYTTAHLEGAEGWIPVFRSARSAVYLRDAPRNAENLRRVARYYEGERVPFDSEQGLEVGRVLARAPHWALRFGLLPVDFALATRQRFSPDQSVALLARTRLANIFAMLGLYERAALLDEQILARDPLLVSSRRRLVWALLRAGRVPEALDHAAVLEASEGLDPLSDFVARSAREIAALEDPVLRAERIALLPVFSRAEANRQASGYAPPELRAHAGGVRGVTALRP